MSIILTQGIFTGMNSLHITFVDLANKDTGIRLPKITSSSLLVADGSEQGRNSKVEKGKCPAMTVEQSRFHHGM